MRFALALFCMFIAVGTPEHWTLLRCILWGVAWSSAAVVLAWPMTDVARRP